MPSTEDPLVAQAFDPKKQDDLARAIEKLSPDEAAYFLHKLELAVRKRKIQITGYLVAMGVWLVSMVLALIVYGMQSGFVAWVLIVPFGLVGLVLYAFGNWSERVTRIAMVDPREARATAGKPRAAAQPAHAAPAAQPALPAPPAQRDAPRDPPPGDPPPAAK